ncbi:DNA repair and recombination protein RadB [Candidatus Woesearchaeota archaeon]|nr:DNA repair and recombination protein RadB [Candidatus Woesearchaeota archaeon]
METKKMDTGSKVFNKLLETGYESDIITTVYGPSGTGKTTLCLLASIAAVKQGKKVIYIDTEGGFSINRLLQLCNDQTILQQIFVLKAMNFEEQIKEIAKLRSMINDKIGLVVIDTIGMLYRIELGRASKVIGETKTVNNELSMQLLYLTEIARKHEIPVLLTNQVYSDFDERDAVKMVGGELLHYGSKCLIELKKFKTYRKAVLKKHRHIKEEAEILFTITEHGFEETIASNQ